MRLRAAARRRVFSAAARAHAREKPQRAFGRARRSTSRAPVLSPPVCLCACGVCKRVLLHTILREKRERKKRAYMEKNSSSCVHRTEDCFRNRGVQEADTGIIKVQEVWFFGS